jgi:hypothetical protein
LDTTSDSGPFHSGGRAMQSLFLNPVKAHRDSRVIRITSVQRRTAYNRRGLNGEATLTWRTAMLAEKFFLLLVTLRSHAPQDGSPRVVTASQHVPIKLPIGK